MARGLAGPYTLPIPDDGDGEPEEYEKRPALDETGGYPAFALEYELVPGVPSSAEEQSIFRYLVGITYSADVELPWEPNDGGVIAPFQGGATTHGSRGDWPLPPNAEILTFILFGVGPTGFTDEHPAGALSVDRARGRADWRPA